MGSPISPLQCTGRAYEILRDMREKRESLIASNPFLHKSQLIKPPTAPRRRESRRRRGSKTESASRAKDILIDMKNTRNSLSSVLETRKTSSKRSSRSEGQSTAPTAASTQSLLSSRADDDSFCYSETAREETPGFQFIIDTEESDLNSLSTRGEVERAVGAIYEKVIPQALSAINKKEEKMQCPNSSYSWNFVSPNSARDLYRDEGIQRSVAEKKRRRIKISEKKKEMARVRRDGNVSSPVFSDCSSTSSVDLSQLREQQSTLRSLLDSVSEMKDSIDSSISSSPCSPDHPFKESRRIRQDDNSDGSYPLPNKLVLDADARQLTVDDKNIRERLSEKKKRRIRIAEKKKEMAKVRRDPVSPSFISAESSLEILEPRRCQTKHRTQQPAIPDMRQKGNNTICSPSTSHSTSSGRIKSLKHRPRQDDTSSGSNPVLANTSHLASSDKIILSNEGGLQGDQSERRRKKSEKKRRRIDADNSDNKNIEVRRKGMQRERPILKPRHQNLDPRSIKGENASKGSLLVSPETSDVESLLVSPNHSKGMFTLTSPQFSQKSGFDLNISDLKSKSDLESDKSCLFIFEEPEESAPVLPVSVVKSPAPTIKSKTSAVSKSDIEYVPYFSIVREPKRLESKTESISQRSKEEKLFATECKPSYTIEDIMAEMNCLATKNAVEGLRIPNGTVLTLRRNNDTGKTIENDEHSCTGWSFSEETEISTLDAVYNKELAGSQNLVTEQKLNSRAYTDITSRYCGGHYHMALLSGMSAGSSEMEI